MNIYAGNLPYTLSESDLKDLFQPIWRGNERQNHQR